MEKAGTIIRVSSKFQCGPGSNDKSMGTNCHQTFTKGCTFQHRSKAYFCEVHPTKNRETMFEKSVRE